jgi:hypothetical protein
LAPNELRTRVRFLNNNSIKMTARLFDVLWILTTIIGLILILNGVVHGLIYLLDQEPIFQGLRTLNWISLILGIGGFSFGFKKLDNK